MSFTRHGSNEELETLTFKCPQCGKKSITLINGICELCGLDNIEEQKKPAKHRKKKKS
jgi:ribosomal protein L37E